VPSTPYLTVFVGPITLSSLRTSKGIVLCGPPRQRRHPIPHPYVYTPVSTGIFGIKFLRDFLPACSRLVHPLVGFVRDWTSRSVIYEGFPHCNVEFACPEVFLGGSSPAGLANMHEPTRRDETSDACFQKRNSLTPLESRKLNLCGVPGDPLASTQ